MGYDGRTLRIRPGVGWRVVPGGRHWGRVYAAWTAGIVAVTGIIVLAGCVPQRGYGGGNTVSVNPDIHQRQGSYHKVVKGETLWSICRRYGVSVKEVTRLNRLPDAARIEKGQMLFIPGAGRPARTHTTDAGNGFLWPVRGKVVRAFGTKSGNIVNKGIEIAVPVGTYIVAARDGTVVFAEDRFKGFGKVVIMEHGGNYQTVYAYNSENLVKAGSRITAGTAIARAGKTGRASVPSLHFEIRKNQEPQNPIHYLP